MQIEDVVNYVDNFLRVEKHMQTQSSPTTEGFVLQASQSQDGWKTITGTRLAITVNFMLIGDVLNVTIGEGQWSDKLGAGALGLFVAWPLAISAGVGAYKQKKLPAEIFATIEKALIVCGRQIEIKGSGNVVGAGMVICPSCKTQNAADAKFCKSCGTPLQNNCPNCGAPLDANAVFCSQCGTKIGG